MSAMQESPNRTLKAKKAAAAPPLPSSASGHAAPTSFFLCSEKDVERGIQRGRKASRDSESTMDDTTHRTPMGSPMADSSFGVQSLEDTIATSAALASETSLSRVDGNVSDASVDVGADANALAGRKRKAGNPVHPKILATGQRIISSERHVHATESPLSSRSAESPLRSHGRRNSASSSSINLSRPLTPLKMSPGPESAMPSTPRSGSPKSFRLSDEEQSIASDTGSQAIQSSSGDDNEETVSSGAKDGAMPQLVMPSISMPARRPFTENGQRIGRLKMMMVGPRAVGKTTLIQSICRVCEDVVHMDSISGSGTTLGLDGAQEQPSDFIVELGASTRPYPAWWTDLESRRMLLRRQSMGEGVLERNLTFIDTPGFEGGSHVQSVLNHFKHSQSRMGNMARMHDSELISMLSGEGGVQIDAVLYLFDPNPTDVPLNDEQTELLKYLGKWSNLVPLIGRADTVSAEALQARKQQLLGLFKDLGVEPYMSQETLAAMQSDITTLAPLSEPYAVSSALGDDPETLDASILMSSGYLQPLMPSQLDTVVSQLLHPENAARLRHISATKFLLWRQEHMSTHLNLQKQSFLHSPAFEPSSPGITSTGSMLDEPSKVLVPHGSSSYFRSTSPSTSDSSGAGNIIATSAQALARYNDQTKTTEPFRQVRLAKWAQDLQRSLENERKRYAQIFTGTSPPPEAPSGGSSGDAVDSHLNNSLIPTAKPTARPPKGHLGGDLGIIDPRDPLGLLAFGQSFRRQGWFAVQIVSSCGLFGAMIWWVAKNWADWQDFLGLGAPAQPIAMTAVPAPSRAWWEWDAMEWRNLLGMQR